MDEAPNTDEGAGEPTGPVLRPFDPSGQAPQPPVERPAPPDAPCESSAERFWSEVPTRTIRDSTTPDTVTLPRKAFLVGLGVLLAGLGLLTLLWQTADTGDAETFETPAPTATSASEPPPTATVDTSDLEAEIASLDEALATSQAEVGGLEAELTELRDRPLPALSGSQLRRIVIGADANVVSAQPDSVAVLDEFGALALIDPSTNRVSVNASVGTAATRVMRTSTSVWVTNQEGDLVVRYNPAANAVAAIIPFIDPDGIEKDGDTIVVASGEGGSVSRLDPTSGEVLQSIAVGGTPTAVFSDEELGLWAAVADTGEIVQIDRDSFEIVQRVVVGAGPVAITAGPANLWVTNQDEGTVVGVDPVAGEVVLTVRVGPGPTEAVVAGGSVWVTVTEEGSLVEVDPGSGELLTRTPLGGSAAGGPSGISFGSQALWIAMRGEQSVVRIDL